MNFLKKSLCLFLSWSIFVIKFPLIVVAQDLPDEPGQADRLSIAVLDIECRGIIQLEAETLTNYMRFELEETGAVATVKPDQIKEALGELGLQETGCTSPECALEVAKLLGVSHVIIGSIDKLEQPYDMEFQMLKVETGAVEKSEKRSYQGDVDGLIMVLQRLVWDIIKITPPLNRFPDEEQQVEGVTNWRVQIKSLAKDLWRWMKANKKILLGGLGVLVVAVAIVALAGGLETSSSEDIGPPPPFPDLP